MTTIPEPTAPATVEQVLALLDDDADDYDAVYVELLLVLAGDTVEVRTEQGRTIASLVAAFTDEQITELSEVFELCPIHRGRDAHNCADDDAPECREYRDGGPFAST